MKNSFLFFKLIICTVSLIILPGCASQQAEINNGNEDLVVGRVHAKSVMSIVFDRLDCDLEGTIETAEVDDHFAQVWHPADIDQSMSLSRREYSSLHLPVSRQVAQALFHDADVDADGKIRAIELREHLQRMILMLDTDGDFEVTRQEAGLKPVAPPRPRTSSLK